MKNPYSMHITRGGLYTKRNMIVRTEYFFGGPAGNASFILKRLRNNTYLYIRIEFFIDIGRAK